MTKISTVQGDTVDLICWKHYGQSSGMVEQVLNANPHLAGLDPILPIGTEIDLPEISNNQQDSKATIQLWD